MSRQITWHPFPEDWMALVTLEGNCTSCGLPVKQLVRSAIHGFTTNRTDCSETHDTR